MSRGAWCVPFAEGLGLFRSSSVLVYGGFRVPCRAVPLSHTRGYSFSFRHNSRRDGTVPLPDVSGECSPSGDEG